MSYKELDLDVLSQQLVQLFETTQQPLVERSIPPKVESSLWNNNPPEAVIFASNSFRKALQLYWALIVQYDVQQWPEFAQHILFEPDKITDAFSIHRFFEERIHNGDGAVRHPFLVGYLPEGVPLLLCPTDGETSGNGDPVQESWNKINHITHLFKGRDVIVFSSDAVQAIRTSDKKLGKPENRPEFQNYPNRNSAEGEKKYKEWYIDTFYRVQDGKPLTDNHHTGVVGIRGEKYYQALLTMSVEVHERLLGCIDVCLQMGGGGIFQQLVKKLVDEDPMQWLHLQNEELTAHLEQVAPELWPYIVIFHIMGMPAWTLATIFEKLSAEEYL